MVAQYNKTNLKENILTLAIWDGLDKTVANYDEENDLWQIVFTNGESCGNLQNIFTLYWQCANEYKVLIADEIEPCDFVIHIQSPLACGSKMHLS